MKSWQLLGVAVCALLLTGSELPADRTAPPTQLMIRVTVFSGDPLGSFEAGTMTIETWPQLITQDGQSATVQIGGTVAPSKERGELGLGHRLQVTATKQDKDKLKVDIRFEQSVPAGATETWAQVHTTGTRLVGTFKFGETIKLAWGKNESGERVWAELRIEEMNQDTTRVAVPPQPTPRRKR